jgi:hypothetical protein
LKKFFNKLGGRRRLLLSASLFLGAAPLSAQSREILQYVGPSQLDAVPASSISSDDLQVSPHPNSDAELAGIHKGPGSAAVPVIANPPSMSPVQTNIAMAFNGISHRDQRFAGTGTYANTQFSTEPPDEGLAVGNGFVLQTVNAALSIYDANTGVVRQGPTALNQFLHLKPEIDRSTGTYGDFTSDPRAYYDPQLQRWLLTVTAIATNPQSGAFTAPTRLLIAVSDGSDPTQGWKIYSLETTNDGSAGCPCFADQPLIGVDSHGFFLSTNAFSLREGYAGVQIYALSKQLLASGSMPAVVHWNSPKVPGGFAFSLQPAIHASFESDDVSASGGVEYFTSVADIRNMLDHRIAVWALTNTASLADASPALKLQGLIIATEPFGVPPDAAQKTGATELGSLVGEKGAFIATNDDRMQQSVFASGKLWSVLTTMVAIGNDPTPHAGIAYFSLTPSISRDGILKAEVSSQGYLAVSKADVFYPALAVGPNGNGAIAFSLSGADYYPSVAFARLNAEGAGDVQILAAGTAPQDGFSGYKYFGGGGSARTGDYSGATIDEQGSIWIASEYVPSSPRTLLANWGTFIAQIAAGK